MQRILVISNDNGLIEKVKALCGSYSIVFEDHYLSASSRLAKGVSYNGFEPTAEQKIALAIAQTGTPMFNFEVLINTVKELRSLGKPHYFAAHKWVLYPVPGQDLSSLEENARNIEMDVTAVNQNDNLKDVVTSLMKGEAYARPRKMQTGA